MVQRKVNILGDSQLSYPNGALMCTSASVCMAVRLISGTVNLLNVDSYDKDILAQIEDTMRLASKVQELVQRGQTGSNSEQSSQGSKNRMTSVHEILSKLNIKSGDMNMGHYELMVCDQGINTSMHSWPSTTSSRETSGVSSSNSKSAGPRGRNGASGRSGGVNQIANAQEHALMYTPNSCYVHINMLPEFLISGPLDSGNVVACIITCNLHTVCVSCLQGVYTFFDSMPLVLSMGLNRLEISDLIHKHCGLPTSRSKKNHSVLHGNDFMADVTIMFRLHESPADLQQYKY